MDFGDERRASTTPLRLPEQIVVARPRATVPLIALLMPVVTSGAIWLATGAPLALVFAGLGPVMAGVTFLFSRRQARRAERADTRRFSRQVAETRAEIMARHTMQRNRLDAMAPNAAAVMRATGTVAATWRPRAPLALALGRGAVASEAALQPAADPGDNPALRDLCQLAARLTDAPVILDLGTPRATTIGVCGPAPLVDAVARGYVIQLVDAASGFATQVHATAGSSWEWVHPLRRDRSAHRAPIAREQCRIEIIRVGHGYEHSGKETHVRRAHEQRRVIRLALADDPRHLPACAAIINVTGTRHGTLHAPGHAMDGETLRLELISAADASAHAHLLGGPAATHQDADPSIALDELLQQWASRPTADHGAEPVVQRNAGRPAGHALQPDAERTANPASPWAPERTVDRTSLVACIGSDDSGGTVASPFVIDLVDEGPHAIVGGTTGSGKSELLVTWVAALAATCSPEEVTFLLVDFKGGAAFAPLAQLPHCVGMITDLGEAEARRALESLTAEMLFREGRLRDAGVRDIAELSTVPDRADRAAVDVAAPAPACDAAGAAGEMGLPRFVVVVDEFATMLERFPELYSLFVDIAARGRSLGVHLILCTQRPAGVIRDALMANCALRMSLRVNDPADSTAVIGTPDAADLPVEPPGTCLVSSPAFGVRPVRVARATPGLLEQIAAVHAGRASPRRPWLDPLPELLPAERLRARADGSIVRPPESFLIGMSDRPREQAQQPAIYKPEADGSLLVVGGQRSGKTTLVDLIRWQAGKLVSIGPHDPEQAWDQVCSLREQGQGDPALLLIDDLDSLFSQLPHEYQEAFTERLGELLRDGPRRGVHVVATVQRLAGHVRQLAQLFASQLLLRMPSRQEHLLNGGDPERWDAMLPAGGGNWRGHRLQVAWPPKADRGPLAARENTFTVEAGGAYAIVASSPGRWLDVGAKDLLAVGGGAVNVIDIGSGAPGSVPPMGAPRQPADALTAVHTGSQATATLWVGDPDAWQAQWPLLTALRQHCTLVFDDCGLADFRAIARSRQLPPVISGANKLWVRTPDGSVSRALRPV